MDRSACKQPVDIRDWLKRLPPFSPEQRAELRAWEERVRRLGGTITTDEPRGEPSTSSREPPKESAREQRRRERRAARERNPRQAVVTLAVLEAARAAPRERRGALDIPCPLCGVLNRCSDNGWGRSHCAGCHAAWSVEKVPKLR